MQRNIIHIDELKCNGCAQCITACAEGALQLVNGKAKLVKEVFCDGLGMCIGECPAGALTVEVREAPAFDCAKTKSHVRSELEQWPVQIHLVQPGAPFFRSRELLVLSTCAPVASAAIHKQFIRGRGVVVGCPKLDRTEGYAEKLAAILKDKSIPGVRVVRMEVPCCGGLTAIVREAVRQSGRQDLRVEEVQIGLDGTIKTQTRIKSGGL